MFIKCVSQSIFVRTYEEVNLWISEVLEDNDFKSIYLLDC